MGAKCQYETLRRGVGGPGGGGGECRNSKLGITTAAALRTRSALTQGNSSEGQVRREKAFEREALL